MSQIVLLKGVFYNKKVKFSYSILRESMKMADYVSRERTMPVRFTDLEQKWNE